jgi:hypothetical protein
MVAAVGQDEREGRVSPMLAVVDAKLDRLVAFHIPEQTGTSKEISPHCLKHWIYGVL